MNLCYDFQKWTMITFASIAITLIIGLVSIAYGQTMGSLEILDYSYEHASDSPNPVQDLIDKGFLSSDLKGATCKSIKETYQKDQAIINERENNRTAEFQDKMLRFTECLKNATASCAEFGSNDTKYELDDNSGVGYYDPPYSYTQCLTVFTKEMCDFRFNSD